MITQMLLLASIFFANFWVWHIKIPIHVATLFISTLLLYFTTRSKKTSLLFTTIISLSLLIFFYQEGVVLKDETIEKDLQQKRAETYMEAPSNQELMARLAYYLELKPVTLSLYQFGENLTYALNPNYYFFGTYPREEQRPGEFEKFSYVFLPFFLIGIFSIKLKRFYILSACSIVSLALMGTSNHLGMFPILPTIVVSITKGITKTLSILDIRLLRNDDRKL